jgi:hypothetical protein
MERFQVEIFVQISHFLNKMLELYFDIWIPWKTPVMPMRLVQPLLVICFLEHRHYFTEMISLCYNYHIINID